MNLTEEEKGMLERVIGVIYIEQHRTKTDETVNKFDYLTNILDMLSDLDDKGAGLTESESKD